MNLKKKILLILGISVLLCIGSFIILNSMFSRVEWQLMEKCRSEALIGARTMSEMMGFMLKTGLLTEPELFDTHYIAIPGTRPQKYHTKYDKIFDTNIQKIEDEFLKDKDVIYAILIDKNGYVPTHNSRFAKPEGPDIKKNLIYSRSKRNFADNEIIKQALLYKGNSTMKLLYHRDTGEIIWNIGAPVHVQGKHWGLFLIGVSLQRIDIIKNQMVIIIVTIMFVILSLTMLAILAVIPRKYLPGMSNPPER